MSEAREEVLGRIRRALRDVPADERADDVEVARGYRREGREPLEVLLARFEQRLSDYGAEVRRVAPGRVGAEAATVAKELSLRRLAVPRGLPPTWYPPAVQLLVDHGLGAAELDDVDGALTGCAAAVAETGTIVLDGGPRSGRRALTLVPDHHLCVVEARQVVSLPGEGLAAVSPRPGEPPRPVTLVSGPSATSDIELTRVQGVHGPRHLVVLLAVR